jgi:hypothetical protein
MKNFILLVMAVLFMGSFVFASWFENTVPKYDETPLDQCVMTMNKDIEIGDQWKDIKICTDSFKEDCAKLNGVFRGLYMHPSPFIMQYCYKKSEDAGVACKAKANCSINCDLAAPINNGTCVLIEKQDNPSEHVISVRTYQCTSKKPGVCLDAPIFIPMNGTKVDRKMKGKKLIETVVPGPIA